MKSPKVKKPGQAAAARRQKAKALGALHDEGYKSCPERMESGAENPPFGPDPKCGECPNMDVKRLMEQIYFEIDEAKYWPHTMDEFDSMGNEETRYTLAAFGVIGEHSHISFPQDIANSQLESAFASLDNPENPLSSAVMEIVGSDFAGLSNAVRLSNLQINPLNCKRYASIAHRHKLPLLSVLAHSAAFRNAALTLDSRAWDDFVKCAADNAASLETFAKVRGLDIVYPLKRVLDYIPRGGQEDRSGYRIPEYQSQALKFITYSQMDPIIQNEHAYVVAEFPGRVRRPMFEGRYQVDIPHNLYSDAVFDDGKQPQFWIEGKPYPSDITQRAPGENVCVSCNGRTRCSCDPSTSECVLHPLVELHEYPKKGVGVRALQHIPAGTILGEYVGVLRSTSYKGDPVYAFMMTLYDGKFDEPVAMISSKRYGNWTRFINHSCNASTSFEEMTLGDKHRVFVCATRDIEMFEEIEINYGPDYWTNRECRCGRSNCVTTKAKE